LAALAGTAGAATDPGMNEPAVSGLDAFRIGTDRHHLADILMPERHRPLHAAILPTEALAAAEIEPAIRQVEIAMADAGGQHLEQHFGALGLRRRLLIELQRLAADAYLEHTHVVSLPRFILVSAGPSAGLHWPWLSL